MNRALERGARRVAVLGGGISGVTAAWQLAQRERAQGDIDITLFEASARLGGIVETTLRDGFTVECGPDGWVTEKPWARELARELGIHTKLIPSLDADRVTYILSQGKLVAIPDGMRMMVPTDLAALDASPLFSDEAKRAYAAEPGRAAELKASAPDFSQGQDESIAQFVERHFGHEVLTKIAAPLLSGVFGGDVAKLSVRAVMPAFVRMEREHGSLILALQSAARSAENEEKPTIFTSLTSGTAGFIDRMKSELPPGSVRLNAPVTALTRDASHWLVEADGETLPFDDVIMALPAHVARQLLAPVSPPLAELLVMDASSAVIAAFAFTQPFELPRGFGFLVPAGEDSRLLAATFVDQKFPGRVPEGGRLLRAFFGGEPAPLIAAKSDDEIAALALAELQKILGPLPAPAFQIVRRWPNSLPQYEVGHLDRVAQIDALVRRQPNLWLLGNAYHGVGLPDLIRDARAAARQVLDR